MTSLSDDRFHFIGNFHNYAFNKKLCFQARDTLYDCVDQQENGNKFRCPDQLYAYEMWCPPDFRRIHSHNRRKEKIDAEIYDAEWVRKLNVGKQTVNPDRGHYDLA